jgi:hypothetical protein
MLCVPFELYIKKPQSGTFVEPAKHTDLGAIYLISLMFGSACVLGVSFI